MGTILYLAATFQPSLEQTDTPLEHWRLHLIIRNTESEMTELLLSTDYPKPNLTTPHIFQQV